MSSHPCHLSRFIGRGLGFFPFLVHQQMDYLQSILMMMIVSKIAFYNLNFMSVEIE